MKNIRWGYFFLTCLIFLMVLPLLILILSSMGTTWEYPQLIPRIDIKAGRDILKTALIKSLRPVMSSLLYSLGTVFMTLLISVFPARYLSSHEFPSKGIWELILLLPALISPFTFLMGIQFILLKLGMGNSYGGVILILTIVSYPYMLRALSSGYERQNRDLFICSENLGASVWQTILRVEIPLLLPSVIAGANIVFLVAFSDYFLVFVMGGARVKSLALLIFPLLSSSSRQIVSLYNLIFLMVPMILFFLIDLFVGQNYRRKGIL